MRLLFDQDGWQDCTYWQVTDRKIVKKINRLIDDITRDDPFEGFGKPEPLKQNLTGLWSRRITDEHRLVYLIKDDEVIILQARYHYTK